MQQLEPKGKQHWEKDLERFWVFLHIMLSNRSLLSNRNKMQTMGGILNYLVMALKIKINSVQFSCSVMSDSFQLHGLQHASPPCPSLTPGAYSNSRPLSQWCHPIILSPATPFFSCPQSFPELGSFTMSQFFSSGGQSTGASASASVLPMNIQGWFPLGLTVWSPCSPRDSQKSYPEPQFESINSLALSLLYGPTLTSVHDYWKKHSCTGTYIGASLSLKVYSLL